MTKDVAYQNKDVLFKILSETYRQRSLKAYGLDLPPIKELLPTNLPALKLDERRADNIFRLEDGRILILEYESALDNKNLIKYGHYAFRVAESYYEKNLKKIILAVIYTGDIETAPEQLDFGAVQLNFEGVFLSKFDGKKIYNDLENKVENNIELEDEDIMRFIILPLTQKKDKQKLIEDTITLAKKVTDENMQTFIIAGIISATDKFIDQDYSNKIKEWIKMSKVARIFEEEKIQALNKLAQEKDTVIDEKNKVIFEMVRRMLEKGMDVSEIMESSGLTKDQIEKIQKNLGVDQNVRE